MTSTPTGRRLGVDVGRARVGVAVSDPYGILASPVETVPRDNSGGDGVPADMARIAAIVEEYEVVEVVVGLPITLSGQESFAAVEVRGYAEALQAVIAPTPIAMMDERLTTAVASRRLAERGVKGKRRKAVVDQAAAVEILQRWLEQRKA